MHRIADLVSYDSSSPYGIAFNAHDVDAMGLPAVTIELTHTDLAFLLAALIDRYGIGNVRSAIDRIALDDPSGKHCGLSAPAKILQGTDPRKAG